MGPRKKNAAVPEIVTLQSQSKSRGKGKKQPKSAEFVVDTDDDSDNVVDKGAEEDDEEDELDSDDDIVYVETKPAPKPKPKPKPAARGPTKRQEVYVEVPPKRKGRPSKSKQADDEDYVEEGSSPSKKRRTVTFRHVNRPLHIDSDPDEDSDSDDEPIVTLKTRKTKAKKAVEVEDDSDLDNNTKKTPTKAKGKSKAVNTPELSPAITPPPAMRPHALVGQVASVLAQALNGTFAKNQAELRADEEMFPDPPSPPPASPPQLLPSSPVMPVTPQPWAARISNLVVISYDVGHSFILPHDGYCIFVSDVIVISVQDACYVHYTKASNINHLPTSSCALCCFGFC
ncbi:hypothetical protein BDN72DRAFT_903032 [Pluteus cervinus]|uniref:Uncharacterized protein n=1 Tax=Pluteus cervinus TaxID=181527 RepID=A0ACD3AAJ8_9AGAR|nr:hypothetical protein BDN72DRAFT_903032 [Pluteus cervinus]